MTKTIKKLLIFNFDGVLAIKWTTPEEYFHQIPNLITKLSNNYILCVASFNTRAQLIITNWGLENYFTCMRDVTNYNWTDIYKEPYKESYRESYRENMTKANQIVHIIENKIDELNNDANDANDTNDTDKLNNEFEFGNILFFDDDPENILQVNEKLPWIKTVLIDGNIGIHLSDIPNYK